MAATGLTLVGSTTFTVSASFPIAASGDYTLVTPGEVVAEVGDSAMKWATGSDPGQVNTFWASRLTISSSFVVTMHAGAGSNLYDFGGMPITWVAISAIICHCIDGNDDPNTARGHAAYLQTPPAGGATFGWLDGQDGVASPFGAASIPICHMTKGSVIVLSRPGEGEYTVASGASVWEIVKHPSSSVDAVIDLLLVGRRV